MATPHHLPALPTAAPITVEVGSGALVGGVADHFVLRRIRRSLAGGERTIRLVVPRGLGQRRLALAASLDVGGAVLVLTGDSGLRNWWRRVFRRLCQFEPRPQSPQRARRDPTSLTSITVTQLHELLTAAEANPALDEPPLKGLSTLIIDAVRLRRRHVDAITELLDRNALSTPVTILLGDPSRGPVVGSVDTTFAPQTPDAGGRRPRWRAPSTDHIAPQSFLRATPVHIEPALLVRSRRLVEFQELYWLASAAPSTKAALAARLDAAFEIVEELRHDRGNAVPGLARFVASQLPRTHRIDGSVRSAYLSELSRSRSWTVAVIRTHCALGGQLPRSVHEVLAPLLEPSVRPSPDELARTLARYFAHLGGNQPARIERRRLVREALARLGYRVDPDRLDPVALTPSLKPGADAAVRILQVEMARADRLRAVVLCDHSLSARECVSAIGAVAHVAAVDGDRVVVSPECHGAFVHLAREMAAQFKCSLEVEATGVRLHGGAEFETLSEIIGAALAQDIVQCIAVAPAMLEPMANGNRALVDGRVSTVIDLCGAPGQLALTAAPLLARTTSTRPERVTNLWTASVVPHGPFGVRQLELLLGASQRTGTIGAEGKIQYGVTRLRGVFDECVDAERGIGRFDRAAFNTGEARRALNTAGAHEGWRAATGARRTVAVEIRPGAPTLTRTAPLAELGVGHGAQMSERRARHRLFRYTNTRRKIVAQAVVASVAAGLILPTIAGPILGSAVAIITALWIVVVALRRQRMNRQRNLYRPPALETTVRDIASVVLRTLRSCDGIRQRDLPTRLIQCIEAADGSLLVWLDYDDERLVQQFAHTLVEALSPIGAQRYIVGRPQTRVPTRRSRGDSLRLHVASYHPVPSLFGSRRERAEVYAGHWAQVFGPGNLRYTAGGKGRLLRFAQYGRDHLGINGRCVLMLV